MSSSVAARIEPAFLDSAEWLSLPGLLRHWAAVAGDRTAITHLDYRDRPGGVATSLTWRQLERRVASVSEHLRGRIVTGWPVAILAGQTADYIVAFLAALRAGALAVPLFSPDLPGHGDRLTAVLADCRPAVVLTTARDRPGVEAFLAGTEHAGVEIIAVDSVEETDAGEPVLVDADDVAYLQYTSGSTGIPRGVMITHGNVVVNAQQALHAYGAEIGKTVTVSWLPLFHDMGLVLSIAGPLAGGMRTVLMDPIAFLERPERWLRALSANPGALSAAPSFAYALSAARVSETEKARLRLDTVTGLIDGSEPVRPVAIERFLEAFAQCGLRPEAHRPSYGLAEATVFVSASTAGKPPVLTTADRAALAAGRLVPAVPDAPDAAVLVSCGTPIDQRLLIVDPDTRVPLPDGVVGEIWLDGPNIGQGYWGRPDETRAAFGAVPAGGPDGRWLRTGDLGVRYGGELYVTGRIKDLIIVDGRNHYPDDVEHTAERAHTAIRPRNVVAFAVDTTSGEGAVVLAEHARHLAVHDIDASEVAAAVRGAVSARHGLALHDVRLVPPDSLPRTSSGKIARHACRDGYLGRPGRR